MPKPVFSQAIQDHDTLHAAALLAAGDSLKNVAARIYNRVRQRPEAYGNPGHAIGYTGEVIQAAYANLEQRPDLQNLFNPTEVLPPLLSDLAIVGLVPPTRYDLDTTNRLWVLEELHGEVQRFQKNPSNAASLRDFLQQTESYIFEHPDRELITDSSNVNYVLANYAEAARLAVTGADSTATKRLQHFTSGPYSVEEALKSPDPIAYLHDWTATDLGIQQAIATPDYIVAVVPSLQNRFDTPQQTFAYGGLTTDHPLLRKIVADHEPYFPSHQRELSIAVNALEKGYSKEEVRELLMFQRSGVNLTDTAGKNLVARFIGQIRNRINKPNDEMEVLFGCTHQEFVTDQAASLRAAFHRALDIENNDNIGTPNLPPPTYHGLETDHPMIREMILAHAGDNPQLQRALSLAVNGVEQAHTQQRIFRDLNTHRSAPPDPSAVAQTSLSIPQPPLSIPQFRAIPVEPPAPRNHVAPATPSRHPAIQPTTIANEGKQTQTTTEPTAAEHARQQEVLNEWANGFEKGNGRPPNQDELNRVSQTMYGRDANPIAAPSFVAKSQPENHPTTNTPAPSIPPGPVVTSNDPAALLAALEASMPQKLETIPIPEPKKVARAIYTPRSVPISSAPAAQRTTVPPEPRKVSHAFVSSQTSPSLSPASAAPVPQPAPTVPATRPTISGPTHPVTPSEQVLARSDTPRTVATPHALNPLPSNKDILNVAKEIHAKFQQQLRLQQILSTPIEFAQGRATMPEPQKPTISQTNTVEKEVDTQRQPTPDPVERNRPRFRSRSHGGR